MINFWVRKSSNRGTAIHDLMVTVVDDGVAYDAIVKRLEAWHVRKAVEQRCRTCVFWGGEQESKVARCNYPLPEGIVVSTLKYPEDGGNCDVWTDRSE